MRVTDKPSVSGAISERSRQAMRPSGEVFGAPAQFSPVARSSQVASVFSVVPLDAVLALQGGEDDQPVERRRRQVRRGVEMVEGLDRLKVAFLTGSMTSRDLDYLEGLLVEKRDDDVPPDLGSLFDAVDVRVAVELAKRGR